MGFVPLLIFFESYECAILCQITTVFMVASPLILRWSDSVTFSATILILATLALFAGVSMLLGGIEAATMPVLPTVPLLGVLLLGRAAGIFWGVVSVAFAVAMFGLETLGFQFPVLVPGFLIPFLRLMGLFTVIAVSLGFILLYDQSKAAAVEAIKRSNRRMTTMIAHLDATSDALSRSAAEFLGTELDRVRQQAALDDSVGLTQKMLSTATISREMIGGVGASIRGMIAQYQNISERVYELHQQSGSIIELVAAIDTISDRLDLMALNTGIEASHAGEHGKRFQLLAEDMRRLAERVVLETDRIKTLIRNVQRHTEVAIEASLRGQALTDEGARQLESMARTFDDMHALIERTAEASQRITNDTMAQLETIGDLVGESLRGQSSAS